MTDVTALGGTRAGACVVRAETDGCTGLWITVTARLDVEDAAGDRRTVTTSVATAVREFLQAFAWGA